MSNKDDFDIFLENELKNSYREFDGEAFRQRVLNNLPGYVGRSHLRNLIIYVSAILACLAFFMVIDFGIIRDSILEIYYFICESMVPSIETILLIAMIIFIIYVIPKVEYSSGIA